MSSHFVLQDIDPELRSSIEGLKPELGIKIRKPIAGGLSGADVFLVECQLNGERRLAVLKIASKGQADSEIQGDRTARDSWLNPFLPEHFQVLGELPGRNKIAVLSSLARDRVEDCQTLEEVICSTFDYGAKHVLHALSYVYRQQAKDEWHSAIPREIHDIYQLPIKENLGEKWLKRWKECGLPDTEFPGLVFDDVPERWPNPIAFLFEKSLWKELEATQISVPWIQNHGDLNARNVLCPSYHRAASNNQLQRNPNPSLLLRNISLIDLPFTRITPFTFDLSFLIAGLRVLLPKFDNHARRDTTLATYRAGLEEIVTNKSQPNIPADGVQFAKCLSVTWTQLRMAQERMGADIEKSFLANLAAASLWQAIKAVDRQNAKDRDRLGAISGLILSAMALHRLIGVTTRIPGNDFHLWADPQGAETKTWTSGSKFIAQHLESGTGRKPFILVLGRAWNEAIGLPSESDLSAAIKKGLSALPPLMGWAPSPPVMAKMQSLGRLPLAAIMDWSVFRYPREAVSNSLQVGQRLIGIVGGQKSVPDWNDRNACFYFQMCGTLDEVPTVALTGPQRNETRRKLRPSLEAFAKKRGQNLTVIYLGLSESDLRETHNFLEEVWQNKLAAIYIGEVPPPLAEYLREWSVEAITATVEDFLTASADFAPTLPAGAQYVPQRIVQVADMGRDKKTGELVSEPGNVLLAEIPEEDFQAISRAGHLLLLGDLELFKSIDREPRDFLIGHRVTFPEIHARVPVDRDNFGAYLECIRNKLIEKRPQLLAIPSQPGAGASTILRSLAYHIAYELNVPTLVLTSGGNSAFEAIERLYAQVGRSFVVVADPADVPADDQSGIQSRCAPPRYPILFVASRRVFKDPGTNETMPFLRMTLSTREKIGLLERLDHYCPGTSLGRLYESSTDSLFLLTLEAFGGENIRLETFITDLLKEAVPSQRFLLGAIAFFSRYAHRPCSIDFLQILTGKDEESLVADLGKFDQLLVLQDKEGWSCRHEELSLGILQYHLTEAISSPGEATNPWRYRLADWTCELIKHCVGTAPGGEIAADYIWAILNPQLESYRAPSGEKMSFCRLLQGEDGIPENVMREMVYRVAAEQFPDHFLIVSHFGKFLSEAEHKYTEAEQYLEQARQLEPNNQAVLHMLGKRFYDEARQLMKSNPPKDRQGAIQERINGLAESAQHWFDQARDADVGSEYSYTTAIQMDIVLIEDEFKRLGIQSGSDDPPALLHDRIANQLTHADSLVADGLRYIDPSNRKSFGQVRDRLLWLRGDLDSAIRCFEKHVSTLSGPHRAIAQVQLTRFYLERGEKLWVDGQQKKAYSDFEAGQRQIWTVLQDPARRYSNIKLWYQCARYMRHWHKQDFLDHLHQMHEHSASLDSSFLLMCLYFADAVETGSLPSWRQYEQYRMESDRRSANLTVRTYIREWLVEVTRTHGKEFAIYPNHLLSRHDGDEDQIDNVSSGESRVRLPAVIDRVRSSTQAFLKLEPMGFELFFKPRIKVQGEERRYYPSDEGKRVTCAVAFTYEKPIAYDVKNI